MNKHFNDTMFQVMFVFVAAPENGNVMAHAFGPGDLLSCDKWKCHRTAHETDSDKSLLNECDGCHVQEEHV